MERSFRVVNNPRRYKPPTKKQHVARKRNHYILRLRGPASLFRTLKGYDEVLADDADRALESIDNILFALGARMEKQHEDKCTLAENRG